MDPVRQIALNRKEKMEKQLLRALKRTSFLATRSYVLGLALVFLSVGASAAAGIMNLFEFQSKIVTTTAFLSGFATLLATTFKLQEKAGWYYARKDKLYELYNRLEFQGPPETEQNAPQALKHIEDIANEWIKANYALAEGWKDLQVAIDPKKGEGAYK
ncbi:MAG: hypothetical protein R3D62_06325 [Xanthobacteraceae bacterium]